MSEGKRKIVFRIYDGEHFWGNDEVFPEIDREALLALAQRTRNRGQGEPVIMEEGRPAVDLEKIQCERCRRNLERSG
jgi:hypothetical protein